MGTRLVTGGDEPALGGVYKLGAVRRPGEEWQHRLKISEQAIKTTSPGIQQIRRFETDKGLVADIIYDEEQGLGADPVLVEPMDPTRLERIPPSTRASDLLEPVVRGGRVVREPPPLSEIRSRAVQQLGRLHPGIKRLVNPHQYPVRLSAELRELKTRLVDSAGGPAAASRPP